MKAIKIIFLFIFCTTISSCANKNANQVAKAIDLTVLQFNIWQEGTVINNGFDAIINEIIRTNADLIALSEVRNYNNSSFDKRLVEALKKKGYTFYAQRSQDSGLLSKYPIISQTALFPLKNDHGSITKAIWTYYIRLDIMLRDLELHKLTLNHEKKKQKLQSII